jgi:hypothetical protein
MATVGTLNPRLVKKSSAELGGNISIPATSISRIGVAYGTSSNPTISGSTVSQYGSFGKGDFRFVVTGLSANTNYHFRPFATSPDGTSYGSNMQFRTKKNIIEIEDGS